MKKTMFITSVIMVVVMAIALTTSSLAWFTAAGSSNVTTTAFKVQAKSDAVQGIALSKTGSSNWGSSIALTSAGTQADSTAIDMQPLVPFSKDSSLANSQTAATNDEVLLTALLGGIEDAYDADSNQNIGTASNNTARPSYFIGNKLNSDNTALFAAATNIERTGYYTDTFYITNTGSGAGAKGAVVSCTIGFWFNDGTLKEYNQTNRGEAKFNLDANLCVAVLIQTGVCDDDASDAEWELLAFNRSQGTATNVAVGKAAANFDTGAATNASCATLTLSSSLTDGSKTSTDVIRPQRNISSVETDADVLAVRVVAWYEGASLTSVNAADADLMFTLTFAKTDTNYGD